MSGIRQHDDNRASGPERPFAVHDDELERALRETLARQVATPRPLGVDPAGAALRRARRAGRRRALTGLALAGVATALVTTGMAQLGGPDGHGGTPTVVLGDPRGFAASPLPTASTPVSRPGPVRAELDLLVGNRLDTSDGERRELTEVGGVERGQRVHDREGWLLTSAATAAGRTLWWVPADGPPQVMLAAADAVAVSADGRQVAWRDGPDLLAAAVVAGQLIAPSRVTAPAGVVPVGFTGDDVLLRAPGPGGISVWRRDAGGVPGATNPDVRAVYGTRPDGRLVGLVSGGPAGQPCLALLDPTHGLTPTRTVCGPKPAADGLGGVSPDGRWLLVNGTGRTALLVDLADPGATPATHPAGPPLAGAVAWTRAGAALHVDAAGGLLRVEPGRVLAGERPTPSAIGGTSSGQRPVVVADVPVRPDGA
ncbi:hypothetical protein [Micromonospora sp. NBS 11-29]|uniref:hypothetical protein n=1 Tax=Micromonospora sp. NBS 11-29 TaxID=1960879 RepID=UPI000B770129|nr:hypothetical protein [Micromonospora sp. NBS 11-29]